MAVGSLKVKLIDTLGVTINGSVVAKRGSTVLMRTTGAGVCTFDGLAYGTWSVTARSSGGCWVGGPVSVGIDAPQKTLSLQLATQVDCGGPEPIGCKPCPPCPPCPQTVKSAGPTSAPLYGSSTRMSGIHRIHVGGTNMSDCRWIPSTATPAGSLNADGSINKAAFIDTREQMVAAVGEKAVDDLTQAVILEILNMGEDAADAYAIAMAAEYGLIQDASNGKWYALVMNAAEYSTYVGLFELKCGVALSAPWMVLGGILFGATGLAIGNKFGKGKKNLATVLGGVSGAATGAVLGLVASKVATPGYMKTAGLGRLGRRGVPRIMTCSPGLRWSPTMRKCVPPRRDPWAQ